MTERAGFRGVVPALDTGNLAERMRADYLARMNGDYAVRLRTYPPTAQVVPETCPACDGHGAWKACDCLTGPCPHEPLECGRCNGAGWVPQQCARCGEHDATQHHGDDALCTACWLDAEEQACETCGGTGRVEREVNREGALGGREDVPVVMDCEDCGGEGRVRGAA